MTRAALLVVALSACTARHWDRATLVAAGVTLAADWNQTRSMAAAGWPGGTYEGNPVLGTAPDRATVDTWFAFSALATTAVWLALPERYRSAWGATVTTMEAVVVARNAPSTGWMP